MTKEELKDKCAKRAKIFQEAMESCKSSNPADCIEWFADKIIGLEKACHKWFMRWREAKKDALYFDSRLQEQIEATYKVVEKLNEAKGIISKFLNAKSIEETCVAESEAEQFLKENCK